MTVIRQLHPEAVSLALAELIPDDAAAGDGAAFLNWIKRERIAPQYILYTPNDVARFHALHRRGVIPQRRPFALFVLGRYLRPTRRPSSGRATCCPISRPTTPPAPGRCARSARARAPAC